MDETVMENKKVEKTDEEKRRIISKFFSAFDITENFNQYYVNSDFIIRRRKKGITLYKYVGSKTEVIIPSVIQNLPVTNIGKYAFDDFTNVYSVIIPDSVIHIEEHAFFGCLSLSDITIGNGVTDIGEEAFYHCVFLTDITIPNSVKRIGKYAFFDCAHLTSLKIGNGVTSIGEYAFDRCPILTSVTFEGSIPFKGFGSPYNFPGDLHFKFYATDKENGTPGTYTRKQTEEDWTLNKSAESEPFVTGEINSLL